MFEYHPIYEQPTDVDPRTGCMMSVITILTIVLAILSGIVFGSCSRTTTQVVERVRTDTLRLTNVQHDSIFIHDSTDTRQERAGDTIYIYKNRLRTEYRDRWQHDTLYQSRTDSVPVPYPVIKEVNRLTWWQKTLAWTGAIALFVIFAVVVIKLFPFKLP